MKNEYCGAVPKSSLEINMKKYIIEITVFICGAIGMVLELVAARVLSPYIGSSNLIWTTIIGIMLTSMSIGYWLGGKIVDKKPDINILSILILIGSFFTSLIPVFENLLVNPLAKASGNLVLVAIITAATIFGIPSFILATVSPFAVKLRDKEHENIGKTSGRISSLSTIGSIIGTFLTGFVLIPNLGVRAIILITTIILFLVSIVIYEEKNLKYLISMFIILLVLLGTNFYGKILFEKYNPDIVKDVDSEYSRIWIRKLGNEEVTYKIMQVDTGIESYINQKTNEMGAKYLYYYNLFDYYNKDSKSTLMIGGAAYTYPTYYLNTYKDKIIDVVEIDEKMTELAKEQFGLDATNKRLKIYHQDGRSFLNYTKNKYDTILIDAFKGVNAPFELTTYEALLNAKNKLNDNGMVITNIISSLEGVNSNFIQYEYATYKKVFEDVKLFKVGDIDRNEKQNLILIGFKGEKNIDDTKYEKYTDWLDDEIIGFESAKQVVTDNYAPIGN